MCGILCHVIGLVSLTEDRGIIKLLRLIWIGICPSSKNEILVVPPVGSVWGRYF
jgi:hypothetical protein